MFNGGHMLKDLIINLGVIEKGKKTQKTPQTQVNLTIDKSILPTMRGLSTVCTCILIDKIQNPYLPSPYSPSPLTSLRHPDKNKKEMGRLQT